MDKFQSKIREFDLGGAGGVEGWELRVERV
jgi:hypothetical protein